MENPKLSIAILTGNELRHRYFVDYISRHLNVSLVAFEKKANLHEQKDYGIIGNRTIKKHFNLRKISEEKFFFKKYDFSYLNVINLDTGEINKENFKNKLINISPDYILLFGCSLVDDEILNKFKNRVINLHLGLSPYYRGSGTLFWPLVDNLPECVGSTIHLAVKKIDAGGILKQVRPEIKFYDSSHDIGNRTIVKSAEILPRLVLKYHQKKIYPLIVNHSNGKLCLRKHLTPSSISKLNENFKNDIISKFLKDSKNRIKKYPIIE